MRVRGVGRLSRTACGATSGAWGHRVSTSNFSLSRSTLTIDRFELAFGQLPFPLAKVQDGSWCHHSSADGIGMEPDAVALFGRIFTPPADRASPDDLADHDFFRRGVIAEYLPSPDSVGQPVQDQRPTQESIGVFAGRQEWGRKTMGHRGPARRITTSLIRSKSPTNAGRSIRVFDGRDEDQCVRRFRTTRPHILLGIPPRPGIGVIWSNSALKGPVLRTLLQIGASTSQASHFSMRERGSSSGREIHGSLWRAGRFQLARRRAMFRNQTGTTPFCNKPECRVVSQTMLESGTPGSGMQGPAELVGPPVTLFTVCGLRPGSVVDQLNVDQPSCQC